MTMMKKVATMVKDGVIRAAILVRDGAVCAARFVQEHLFYFIFS